MRKLLIIIILTLLLTGKGFCEEYYIGRWQWYQDPILDELGQPTGFTQDYWAAPQKEFLTGAIDLRSSPQKAIAGGAAQGWALFSYSQAVSSPGLFSLSNAIDKKLTKPVISKIETELGVTIQSTNVRDTIWEILTLHGDPTGQARWKPLMPGVDLKQKVYFGTAGK